MLDQKTGRSRGFGFVSFRNQQDAQECYNSINDLTATDKHITVSSLLLPKPYTPMAELERLFWGANLFWRGRIEYLFGVKSGTISSMDFHRTSYFSNSRLQSSIVDDGGTLLRYLAKILAPEGSKNVAVGQAIAITVEDPADVELLKSYGSGNMAAKEAKPAPPASHDKEVKVQKSSFARISPSAKLLIAQHKLDASSIMASGAHGTLLKSDVLTAIKSGTGATKSSSFEPKTTSSSQSATHTSLSSELQQSDSYEDLPNTQIRKVIARRLLESKQSIPHLYLTADVILDPLLTFRKELKDKFGVKVSVNDIVIKCVAIALRNVPKANAFWDDKNGEIVLNDSVDISIAVATEKGLMTPIVKNADQKSISSISSEIKELAAKARAGKLTPNEFQGGTFSISNLGMFPVDQFCAIINPPQSGILAVGRGNQVVEPVFGDDGIEKPGVVTKMNVTLSADHRVFDGEVAGAFLGALKSNFSDIRRLLI